MPPHEYIDWEIKTSQVKGTGRDNLQKAIAEEIKRQFADNGGLCVMVVVAEKHQKRKSK